MISLRCPFHVFVIGAAGGIAMTSLVIYLKNRKTRIPVELCGTMYDNELKLATKCALLAGKNITDAIDSQKQIDVKGLNDFVTETDKLNEKIICSMIKSKFPSHKFIGEETSSEDKKIPEITDSPTWIVDPIDGTTNFVHTFPMICVSIALMVNKQVILGVVYCPNNDELFQSIRGHGAYLNSKKIHVSKSSSIKDSLVLSEFGYQRESTKVSIIFDCFRGMLDAGAHAVRQLGSGVLDLCYVGCGRLDVAYAGVAGEGWCPWDYAAGSLMVVEGGGCLSSVDDSKFDIFGTSVVATSTSILKDEVVAVIKTVKSRQNS